MDTLSTVPNHFKTKDTFYHNYLIMIKERIEIILSIEEMYRSKDEVERRLEYQNV